MHLSGILIRRATIAVMGLAAAALVSGEEPQDWRLELLSEDGGSTETARLEELRKGFEMSPGRMEKAIERLGADEFAVREEAEQELLVMGKQILPALREFPRPEDPEVRIRLAKIERDLQADGRWGREDLVRHAVTSLLRERLGEEGGRPGELVFAEFFGTATPGLADDYRKFRFAADGNLKGLVADGVLRMKGDHDGDGDQRLLLSAGELTGGKEFPESFRVEVKLGGEDGGGGAFHIGVSVGNVRALVHPNYPGGGFRFEQVDDNQPLTETTEMGFDLPVGKLVLMTVEAKRLPDGKVELAVSVGRPGGGEPFVARKVFERSAIGKLEQIGLDRSGRDGGDALFDDLVVDLGGN